MTPAPEAPRVLSALPAERIHVTRTLPWDGPEVYVLEMVCVGGIAARFSLDHAQAEQLRNALAPRDDREAA